MSQYTFDDLIAIAEGAVDDSLAPCERSAIEEAFEGGGGEGPAEAGATGTVDSHNAADALLKFVDDLQMIAALIQGGA